ncbi:MAG: hypothetical protein PF904_12970 [Kiritimatiellae bacterium]|jgi:predicted Fe-Mo cluster-binding NifX family protein|nr:hypothetical protein [Kiritimatiellia bacterium]
MIAVFSVWNNRIAPVFDTAAQIVVVEIESGSIVGESEQLLTDNSMLEKVLKLKELKTDVLVCGAVSRLVREQIVSGGIEVVSFISGDLRRVIDGWMTGHLEQADFVMPGCCGGRHRRAGHCAGNFQTGTGGRKRHGQINRGCRGVYENQVRRPPFVPN